MMEKKFPFPGEVLSENHQFRTSKPSHSSPPRHCRGIWLYGSGSSTTPTRTLAPQ